MQQLDNQGRQLRRKKRTTVKSGRLSQRQLRINERQLDRKQRTTASSGRLAQSKLNVQGSQIGRQRKSAEATYTTEKAKLGVNQKQLNRQGETAESQAILDKTGINNTINRTKLRLDRINQKGDAIKLDQRSNLIDKKGLKKDLRESNKRYRTLQKLSRGKLSRLQKDFQLDKQGLQANKQTDLRKNSEQKQQLRAQKEYAKSDMGRRQEMLKKAMEFSLSSITNEQKQLTQNVRNQRAVKGDAIRANKAAYKLAKKEFGLDTNKIKNTLKHQKASSKLQLKMENKKFQSAKKSVNLNKQQIDLDKYEANMRADANRMTKPVKAPPIPKPYKIPYTIYQAPRPPMKGPKPIKNVAYQPSPFLTGAQSFVSNIDAGAIGAAMGS